MVGDIIWLLCEACKFLIYLYGTMLPQTTAKRGTMCHIRLPHSTTLDKERGMQPEWSGDPEVKPVFLAVTLTGMVAFLLMVWLFAFYW